MLRIEINYQVKTKHLFEGLFKTAGRKLIKVLKLKGDFNLSVAFVSPKEMRKLNRGYRGKDKATDVLSFEEINEIIICYVQARQNLPAKNFQRKFGRVGGQAQKNRRSIANEIVALFIHGFLHLLGYEDETTRGARKMSEITQKVIE